MQLQAQLQESEAELQLSARCCSRRPGRGRGSGLYACLQHGQHAERGVIGPSMQIVSSPAACLPNPWVQQGCAP